MINLLLSRFLKIKINNERIASKHIILCKTDNGDQQIIWSLKLTPNSLDCWAAVLIFERGQELRWAGHGALTEGLGLGPGKQKVDQPGAGGSVQWPVLVIVWQLNSQNSDQHQIFPWVVLYYRYYTCVKHYILFREHSSIKYEHHHQNIPTQSTPLSKAGAVGGQF